MKQRRGDLALGHPRLLPMHRLSRRHPLSREHRPSHEHPLSRQHHVLRLPDQVSVVSVAEVWAAVEEARRYLDNMAVSRNRLYRKA